MAGVRGRTNEGTEESKQRILDATMELAGTRGYEGTTIAMVSKRSGLPTGSVYWHFENKDKLFVALIDRTFQQWQERLQGKPEDTYEDVRLRLVGALAGAADEHDPSQGFWRLGLILTLERRMDTTLARQRFLEIRAEVCEMVSSQWARVLPPRVLEKDPEIPMRLARFVMATADGLYVSISAGEYVDIEGVTRTLLDAIDMFGVRAQID